MPRKYPKSTVPSGGPKKLDCSTVLPGIFDTLWDAKTGRDLLYVRGFRSNNQLHRLLAEFEFDVREWLDRVERLWSLREAYEAFSERLCGWADALSNADVAACEAADREALRPLQIAYIAATGNAMDKSPLVTEDMVVTLLTRNGLWDGSSFTKTIVKARKECGV